MAKPRASYKDWITEDGLKKIEDWVSRGLSVAQVAKNMGCNVRTLFAWREKYPPIEHAFKKARMVVIEELENTLNKRSNGYEVEESKTYVEEVDGKIKKRKEITKRHIPPDVTALIFSLTNLAPEKWQRNATPRMNEKIDLDIKKTEVETDKIKAEIKLLQAEPDDQESITDFVNTVKPDDKTLNKLFEDKQDGET